RPLLALLGRGRPVGQRGLDAPDRRHGEVVRHAPILPALLPARSPARSPARAPARVLPDGRRLRQPGCVGLASGATDRGGPANRAEIAAETAADRMNLTG